MFLDCGSAGWGFIMSVSSTGAGDPGAEQQQFVYDGKLGELYGIFLVNVLLGVVTLGFYRFWGRTRMRRYIWSHVSFDGDPFEYTGTGGELFVGFLIVIGMFITATVAKLGIQLAWGPHSALPVVANFVFILGVVYLVFVARYAAQRYRLTRTSWRGISGGMTGSAWLWGIKAILLAVVSGLSLGLAGPWAQMRLLDDRLNNSYFGDAKASAHTSSAPLYVAFLLGIGIMVVGSIALMVAVVVLMLASGLGSELAEITRQGGGAQATHDRMEEVFKHHGGLLIGMGIAFYVASAVLGMVAFAQYYVAMAREIARKLALAELRFGTTITIWRLINRVFWNAVIFIATLGFGRPMVLHRSLRFLADNLQVYGRVEGTEITQSTLPRPRFGEGLLEAFDPGFF